VFHRCIFFRRDEAEIDTGRSPPLARFPGSWHGSAIPHCRIRLTSTIPECISTNRPYNSTLFRKAIRTPDHALGSIYVGHRARICSRGRCWYRRASASPWDSADRGEIGGLVELLQTTIALPAKNGDGQRWSALRCHAQLPTWKAWNRRFISRLSAAQVGMLDCAPSHPCSSSGSRHLSTSKDEVVHYCRLGSPMGAEGRRSRNLPATLGRWYRLRQSVCPPTRVQLSRHQRRFQRHPV
jgi:hypothetical protein